MTPSRRSTSLLGVILVLVVAVNCMPGLPVSGTDPLNLNATLCNETDLNATRDGIDIDCLCLNSTSDIVNYTLCLNGTLNSTLNGTDDDDGSPETIFTVQEVFTTARPEELTTTTRADDNIEDYDEDSDGGLSGQQVSYPKDMLCWTDQDVETASCLHISVR